jgi:hypothetical protein
MRREGLVGREVMYLARWASCSAPVFFRGRETMNRPLRDVIQNPINIARHTRAFEYEEQESLTQALRVVTGEAP